MNADFSETIKDREMVS